ncbi:MAG: short chain dehydrogenase [Methanomassiliicoccales archaeon]|nr:short chain dehydrogenase [Methanomassiliicoccales archaeon]NYT15053.1 short chain dehydrogenase [Methanomassiliicoccales archaeon]
MDWELLFFLIFAAITIAAAVSIMFSKDVVRSVMYLALTFIGVAVIFFFLEAEYVALIQILIYVGAVTVLILFGIMLTKRRLLGGERDE